MTWTYDLLFERKRDFQYNSEIYLYDLGYIQVEAVHYIATFETTMQFTCTEANHHLPGTHRRSNEVPDAGATRGNWL